jgi:hypothetical protein
VDERADPKGAAGTDRAAVGLERAVLLRVALDFAPRIERAVVPDGDKRSLREDATVVEDPAPDPDTQHPPDHILERGAVEDLEV